MPFYAVARGRRTGVFNTWSDFTHLHLYIPFSITNKTYLYRPECEKQVKGFAAPIYKKFKTLGEAKEFVDQRSSSNESQPSSTSVEDFIEQRSIPNVSQPTASSALASIARKRPFSGIKSKPSAKKSKIDEQKTAEFAKDVVKMTRYGNYDFMEDHEGYVQVYTDGACENNGNPNAAAGYGVYWGEGHAL